MKSLLHRPFLYIFSICFGVYYKTIRNQRSKEVNVVLWSIKCLFVIFIVDDLRSWKFQIVITLH